MPLASLPPETPAPAPELRLSVPAEAAALEPARLEVLRFLREHAPLSPRTVYRVELVLEEALMNRIWHAFPEPGEHRIGVWLRLTPDALHLGFEDDGLPFDPSQAAAPERPHSLAEARPGGLGLWLTGKAVREQTYERVDGRNRVALVIARD